MDEDAPAIECRNTERDKGGKEMTKAEKVFEAIMRAKGYTDFTTTNRRYNSPALQTRWNYFQLGWQLRGVQ